MGRVVISWITGRKDQGGSTIDQQLAENLYTGGHRPGTGWSTSSAGWPRWVT